MSISWEICLAGCRSLDSQCRHRLRQAGDDVARQWSVGDRIAGPFPSSPVQPDAGEKRGADIAGLCHQTGHDAGQHIAAAALANALDPVGLRYSRPSGQATRE